MWGFYNTVNMSTSTLNLSNSTGGVSDEATKMDWQ